MINTHRKFSGKMIGIAALLLTFLVPLHARQNAESEVQKYRNLIRAARENVSKLHIQKSQLESTFLTVNLKIFDDKKLLEESNNPLVRFRLDQQLKQSRQLADEIDKINRKIRSLQSSLQAYFSTIIAEIDRTIEALAKTSEKKSTLKEEQQSLFEIIERLENEKAFYVSQLDSGSDTVDWKSVQLNSDDSPRRTRMKTALLNDALVSLAALIAADKQQIESMEKDYKIFEEMLNFYNELNFSIEDEEELFDRNRIDDLQNRLEDILKNIEKLKMQARSREDELVLLRKKVERFKSAQSEDTP